MLSRGILASVEKSGLSYVNILSERIVKFTPQLTIVKITHKN